MKTNLDDKLEAVLSFFNDTTRELTTIRIVIFDETKFSNIFDNWALCPITTLDKNMQNEIIGYFLCCSFNTESYQWVIDEMLNKYEMKSLKTLVSDNTSALRSTPKKYKLCHQKCVWHAQKTLPNDDKEVKQLIYDISHLTHQELVTDLIGKLNQIVPKWASKVFGDELEHMTLAFGARPSYGLVVSSRAESTNNLIKLDLKSPTQYTLTKIDQHIRTCRDFSRSNAEDNKSHCLLPNQKIINLLSYIFQPKVVKFIYDQINVIKHLEIVEETDNSSVYFNQTESMKYKKQYNYHVTNINNQIKCTCELEEIYELPCSHIIKFCIDHSIEIDFSKYDYWFQSQENTKSKILITQEDLSEIQEVEKNQTYITKIKKITGKIQQLSNKKNSNTEKIDKIIQEIKKMNFHKNEEYFKIFQQFIKDHSNELKKGKQKFVLRDKKVSNYCEKFSSDKNNKQHIELELYHLKYLCIREDSNGDVLERLWKELVHKLENTSKTNIETTTNSMAGLEKDANSGNQKGTIKKKRKEKSGSKNKSSYTFPESIHIREELRESYNNARALLEKNKIELIQSIRRSTRKDSGWVNKMIENCNINHEYKVQKLFQYYYYYPK